MSSQVSAFASSPAAGWTLIVSQEADLLFQEVRAVRRFLLVLLALCCLGSLAISFGFSHLVTSPLAQMIATVQKAGATVMRGADQIVAHAEKLATTCGRQAKGIALTNEAIGDLDKSIRGNSVRSQAAAAITRSAQDRQKVTAGATHPATRQVHHLVAEIADVCREQTQASLRATHTLREIDQSLLESSSLAQESAAVARRIREEVLELTHDTGSLHSVILGAAARPNPRHALSYLNTKSVSS